MHSTWQETSDSAMAGRELPVRIIDTPLALLVLAG